MTEHVCTPGPICTLCGDVDRAETHPACAPAVGATARHSSILPDAWVRHTEAMRLAGKADIARRDGRAEVARALFEDALMLEARAATSVEATMQPTHGILHRSAAALAIDAGQPGMALVYIKRGIAARPPNDILVELVTLHDRLTTSGGQLYTCSLGDAT